MPAPTSQQVLTFWQKQPQADCTDIGFVKGSDSRAAFIEWYQDSAGELVVSPRGLVHDGPNAVRAYALYVLERTVKAHIRKGAITTDGPEATEVSRDLDAELCDGVVHTLDDEA